MATQRTVLVMFGQRTRPVSFETGTSALDTQKALIASIKSAFDDQLAPTSSLILQIRDEEWGGVFVDLISQDVPDRSVVKIFVDKDCSEQVKIL